MKRIRFILFFSFILILYGCRSSENMMTEKEQVHVLDNVCNEIGVGLNGRTFYKFKRAYKRSEASLLEKDVRNYIGSFQSLLITNNKAQPGYQNINQNIVSSYKQRKLNAMPYSVQNFVCFKAMGHHELRIEYSFHMYGFESISFKIHRVLMVDKASNVETFLEPTDVVWKAKDTVFPYIDFSFRYSYKGNDYLVTGNINCNHKDKWNRSFANILQPAPATTRIRTKLKVKKMK